MSAMSSRDLEHLTVNPLAVGCTFCGANPGVSCKTRNENFIKTFHAARRYLAECLDEMDDTPEWTI